MLELILLAFLSVALGRRLLRWLGLSVPDVWEHAILAAGLGLGALQVIPFALFALGIGHPVVFKAAVGITGLLLAPDGLAVARAARRACRLLTLPPLWQRGVLIALLALLAIALVVAVCPPTWGDPLMYHITVAERYLYAGRFVYLPTLTYTNWPVGEQMLFALMMGLDPAAPVAIVQFLFGVITLAAVYHLGRRIGGPFVGLAALVLMMAYNNFWQQLSMAFIDVGLTCFVVMATLALYRASEDADQEARWRTIAALFAGLAATTKLTGLWAIFSLVLVGVLQDFRNGRRDLLRRSAGLGLPALAVVLPWFLKTWILTGNPVYPMLYSVFHGIEWTPAGWARFQYGHMIWNTPPGSPPTPQVLARVHLFNTAVGVLVCLATLVRTYRSPRMVLAGMAAVFTACICAGNYFHPRFLMPIFPLVFLCIAAALQGWERLLRPVLAVAGFGIVWLFVRSLWEPSLPEALQVALGRVSTAAYIQRMMPDYEVTQYANRHVPPNARILIGTYENNMAYYRAEALWSDCWLQDSIHYDTQARLEADLKRLKVDYLVLKTTYPDWCAHSHSCRSRMTTEPGALAALAARRGVPLFAARDHTLYYLNWEGRYAPGVKVLRTGVRR